MTENDGNILAVHGASDTLELFLFHSYLEALRRMKKRKRKERKKAGYVYLKESFFLRIFVLQRRTNRGRK